MHFTFEHGISSLTLLNIAQSPIIPSLGFDLTQVVSHISFQNPLVNVGGKFTLSFKAHQTMPINIDDFAAVSFKPNSFEELQPDSNNNINQPTINPDLVSDTTGTALTAATLLVLLLWGVRGLIYEMTKLVKACKED